ncbi:MAG TPA: hypothetical protein VHE83_04230 [Mycobacteriales bacterium]|nr:hypothetical protein [Mycobacteriales bacterium]
MSARSARSSRLVALAVATGTVVVASGLPAVAASHDSTATAKSYAAQTNGFALKVGLHLPGALSALNIDETIALANGTVQKVVNANGASSLKGNGTAALFGSQGLLAPVFDALNKVVNVALNGKLEDTQKLLDTSGTALSNLLAGAVGVVNAKLVPTVDGITQSVLGSTVSSLNVGIAPSLIDQVKTALNGVETQLDTVLSGVLGQAAGALTPVTTAVQNLLNQLIQNTPASTLIPNLQQLVGNLQNLPTILTDAVNNLVDALKGMLGSIVNVDLIKTAQTVVPDGAGLKAVTTSALGTLKLLGGLVEVDPLTSVATADANGKANGASATITKSLLSVHLGNQLQPAIDAVTAALKSITSQLAAPGLTALLDQVVDTVNGATQTLTTQLQNLLNTVNGLLIAPAFGTLGTDVKNVKADGTAATASTQGFGVAIPMPAALASLLSAIPAAQKSHATSVPDLLDIQIVPASASVEQAQPAAAPAKAPSLPKPKVAAPSPHKKLAYTGAELPITAGVASMLLVGAAAATRRRRHAEI